jgi:hypothetical protein
MTLNTDTIEPATIPGPGPIPPPEGGGTAKPLQAGVTVAADSNAANNNVFAFIWHPPTEMTSQGLCLWPK